MRTISEAGREICRKKRHNLHNGQLIGTLHAFCRGFSEGSLYPGVVNLYVMKVYFTLCWYSADQSAGLRRLLPGKQESLIVARDWVVGVNLLSVELRTAKFKIMQLGQSILRNLPYSKSNSQLYE